MWWVGGSGNRKLHLNDMFPRLSQNDGAHGGLADAERFGDVDLSLAGSITTANREHLLSGEFGKVRLFASLQSLGMCARTMSVASRHALRVSMRTATGTSGMLLWLDSATLADHVHHVAAAVGQEQMRRSNAWWVVARVADVERTGVSTVLEYPCDSVSTPCHVTDPELAVSVAGSRTSPQPAFTRSIDLFPEAFRNWTKRAGLPLNHASYCTSPHVGRRYPCH